MYPKFFKSTQKKVKDQVVYIVIQQFKAELPIALPEIITVTK